MTSITYDRAADLYAECSQALKDARARGDRLNAEAHARRLASLERVCARAAQREAKEGAEVG